MRSIRALLGSALLFVAGCSSCVESEAEALRLDEHRWLGEPVTVANLTVWPIHTDHPVDVGPFLTLAEAQEKGRASVREVSDEGQVSQLLVKNDADCPILVCAGTVVRGGKQDRQIAQDFVIRAKTEIAVDAFCVEPGRWSGEADFEAMDVFAVKNVRAKGQYARSQEEVWGKVSNVRTAAVVELNESVYVGSGRSDGDLVEDAADGSSLVDVLELSTERQDDMAGKVRKHFASLEDRPVGFAYAINGRPVTVRTFADPRLLESVFASFVSTMCLEAAFDPGEGEARAEDVLALVRAIEAAEAETVETAAANRNLYRKGEGGYHASCLLGEIALTQDWTRP